ncbi:MAG: ABC transporter substrate-binding protein [Geminicoccaceae bacterium]|nr:ABC transporter substrate-binding protein [Geminicoccaceae bacterium]
MRLKPLLLGVVLVAFAAPAFAADRLVLALDWFVNPDHGPIVVAKEKGYFERHGLDVEVVAPADPNDPPKLVAAGRADIAVDYQPQLHVQVAEGLPLVRIGTLIATPLNSLVVLADGPIHAVADLKGKSVGISVAGFDDALLGAMLEANGLKPDDVEIVNVNFSLSPSLLSGQVDAVIGAYRNFELNQMAIEGRPGRAFHVEEEGVPPYDELVYAANADAIADPAKLDAYRRFLVAVEEATQWLLNHPDDAWEAFKAANPELDDDLNARAWRDTLTRFALRPAALDHHRYDRFARFLRDKGVIKAVPPLDTYAVDLFAE